MNKLNNRGGFTLIEIMVVIVILAMLAALVGPKLMGRTDDAKVTDAKVQIKNIETALKLYKLDNGSYPSTEQGLAPWYQSRRWRDPKKLQGWRLSGKQEAAQRPLGQ